MPRAIFKTPDLPAEFFELDHPTQCLIVRTGLDAFKSLQAGVRDQVVAEMSDDDVAKAAAIRAEGIKSAMEAVKDRLRPRIHWKQNSTWRGQPPSSCGQQSQWKQQSRLQRL